MGISRTNLQVRAHNMVNMSRAWPMGSKRVNTDIMPQKPKMFYRVINVFLIIINLNFCLGMFTAASFTGLNFHERAIIVTSSVLLTLFMIIKEFRVKPLLKRLYLNLSIWAAFMCVLYYISEVW
jgi:hypothetical protein